jgi:very-short-patch-repair endonuclease
MAQKAIDNVGFILQDSQIEHITCPFPGIHIGNLPWYKKIMGKIKAVPIEEVVRLHFAEGLTVEQIAPRFGVSRKTLVARMNEAGFTQRSRSEALQLRMDRSSKNERQRLTGAAHEAARGRIASEKEIASRLRRYYEGRSLSDFEERVAERLQQVGINPLHNIVVGRYLIDLCLPDRKIAIEVDGGNWHTTARKQKQDTLKDRFLCRRGWTLFRIQIRKARMGRDLDKVSALADAIRAVPMPARES